MTPEPESLITDAHVTYPELRELDVALDRLHAGSPGDHPTNPERVASTRARLTANSSGHLAHMPRQFAALCTRVQGQRTGGRQTDRTAQCRRDHLLMDQVYPSRIDTGLGGYLRFVPVRMG